MHPTKRYAFSFKPGNGLDRIRQVLTGQHIEAVLEAAKQAAVANHPAAGGFLIIDLDQHLG